MVFNRGLPNTNLNNVSGASRSNVAWSNGNTYVSGDDFTIGSVGETWIVTGVRTWAIAKYLPGSGFFLGDQYSDVSLYTGASGISVVATGTLTAGSDTNSNPNITHTVVTYTGGLNYQSTSGPLRMIYQNDFTNLNVSIAGGVKYYFGVDGTPRSPATDNWFNHGSNAALSGSVQQGADDRWLVWPKSGLTNPPVSCNSNGPIAGVCDGGWDKTSDINVQVFAHKQAAPQVVGGTGSFVDDGANAGALGDTTASADSSVPFVPIAASIAGAVVLAAGAGWYARRRRTD